MKTVNPCIIWYIGSSNEALRLKTEYNCEIHIFEPIYSSYVKFIRDFKNFSLSHIYNYGLGKLRRNFKQQIRLKDDRSHILNMVLRKLDVVYKELSNGHIIDLFHIGCEGCELEIIQSLIDYDLLRNFKTIQFGSRHYFF